MNKRLSVYVSCLAIVVITFGCSNSPDSKLRKMEQDSYFSQRKTMVDTQIKSRGVRNQRVLDAMMSVPRHKFVPDDYVAYAYDDMPLPIGYGQTISQPYIVAYMTEILRPDSNHKVLEIGTGSGYQAAILSLLYKEVYSVEIIEVLGQRAIKTFDALGYKNIKVKIGDGYKGWSEHAPFDAIIVTCAPTNIPQPLMDQLAEGGKMIIPVGERHDQVLFLLEKRGGKIITTETLPVRFVPMVREL